MRLQEAYKAVFILEAYVLLPPERLDPGQEFREPGSAENGRFQADEPRLQVPRRRYGSSGDSGPTTESFTR